MNTNFTISLFYSHLQNKLVLTKSLPMQAWEKDFNGIYSEDQWQTALNVTYSSIKSANLWELFQKMVLRWYLTPCWLSKFALGVSPLCWRQCGEVGTLFHLLWSCSNITQYWKRIYNLISQVLKINLEPSPGMALLSLEMDLAPHHMRTLLYHILLASRLYLVRHWNL